MSDENNMQKVFFKGESMWVELLWKGENLLLGHLRNRPLNAAVHQYRMDDLVLAYLHDYGDFQSWEPYYEVNPKPSDGEVSSVSVEEVWQTQTDDPDASVQ